LSTEIEVREGDDKDEQANDYERGLEIHRCDEGKTTKDDEDGKKEE